MDPKATDLALDIPQQPEIAPSNTAFTDAVEKAWKSRCSILGEEEKKNFEVHACDSLEDYLEKVKAACQKHREESFAFQVIDWFEPIFKAVELFTPAASAAIQAYPNPGSLILGGIIGVLQITSRLLSYQKFTMQMLAKMGRKARILIEYKRDLYKDDYPVQRALIQVYGDILAFCQKAFRVLTKNGQIKAKVKGLSLIVFRDYESQLGKEVQDFENHMEELESMISLCDQKRLKKLHDSQEAHHKEFGQVVTEAREHFNRQDDVLVNLLKIERDIHEQTNRRRRMKDNERMLNWLSPLSFRTSYDQRCEEHLDGTGSWFLDSDLYKKWKSNKDSDLLLVRGKPGCGKSVLAAVAVTDLKLEMGPETALAYAFCRREDESSQNPTAILAALAKQIIQLQPGINSDLESEFLTYQSGEPPSQSTTRRLIYSALSHFTTTFLVIDALDECNKNNELARHLLDLVEDKGVSPVKIIVFSRHDFHIENCFQHCNKMQPDIGNEEDLKAYIYSLFPDDSQARVNEEIRKECIEKANGMFLWVKLLAQNLQKQPLNSNQKLKRIKVTPPGLESMYDRILKDIYNQDEDVRSTAFLVLIWATHARRSLLQFEMLEAVADYSEATTMQEVFKLTKPEELIAICANLVFIDKDGYFRLCHESVRGYLDQTSIEMAQPLVAYQQQKQDAHKRLAEICLNYLLLKDFECGPAKSLRGLSFLVRKFPFLAYAAEYWGLHISQEIEPLLHNLILKFVLSPLRRELSMQIVLFDDTDDSSLWKYPRSSNPLHVLSIFGLRQTAETLPDVLTLLNEADGSGATPLSYSLREKHHDMSLWLVERGRASPDLPLNASQKILAIHLSALLGWADILEKLVSEDEAFVNSKSSSDGRTPLVRACIAGEKEAATTLIDNGANVNLADETGDSPLIAATFYHHRSIVDILLEKGALPNFRDADGVTPLHYAAMNGDAAIALALLEKEADPSATATIADNQTPLHIAAEHQSVEVIKALHRVNPKMDMKSKNGCTALHVAAWHNSFESAKVLLELGAPKDEVNEGKETALFIAAQEGALDTVKVLIEAGCDVNVENSVGRTAMHAAAGSGKLSVVSYIIRSQPLEDWKALVNKQSESGESPIHAAIGGGNADVVKFLLKAGADGSAKGVLKSSALHYVAHYGHKAMLRPLLNYTKDANPRNEEGDTPLHFAARVDRLDFLLQFFQDCSQLDLNVEIESQNNSKKTALMVALDRGCEGIAKFLMEKGIVSIPDTDGNYPIHQAAWHGFDSIVQALLAHDGTTNQGHFGRTPLFCAALRGQLKILKLLAPLSDRVLNVRDNTQMTPVLAALSHRHLEVANYLLDIHADYSVVDEHEQSLLHLATSLGDLSMVQRLLNLGCKGDAINRYGVTPFHGAADADSIEVFDALIAAGFNAINVPDCTGSSSTHIAARKGNLQMLRKLEAHGAQFGFCNLAGRTTAFAAAECGHWEVLDFLKERGFRLNLPDLDGNTTLIVTASAGYLETVRYLLQGQPHAVNDYSILERQSPISEAAKWNNPLTIKCLLAAGADPYHRDAFGLNALDYASCHTPSRRELLKAGHFRDADSLKGQRPILFDTIQLCCRKLLPVPRKPSVLELYDRISNVVILSHALTFLQDYDAAKLCYMEIFWPPKFAVLASQFECEICRSLNFPGDKYICKSCYRRTGFCKTCYEEYTKAGRGAPKVIEEIINLERSVQPVRVVIDEGLSLINVCQFMNYFAAGCSWMSTILDKYEAWEQKYNSSSKYKELQRPGQELLNLVKTSFELICKIGRDNGDDQEDIKRYSKLTEKYGSYRRKHRADKEIKDFICKNHDFLLISADENEKIKSDGIDLDSETGRLTVSFLQGVLNKYSHSSGTQAKGTLQNSNEWSAELSKYSDRSKEDEQETPRPRSLKRSFTTPVWNLARRHSGDDAILPITARKILPSSFQILGNEKPNRPRRAQTLPVSLVRAEDLHVQSYRVQMKDTRVFAAIEDRLDSTEEEKTLNLPVSNLQVPTVKKTVSVSFVTEPSNVHEQRPIAPITLEENNGSPGSPVVSGEESILNLALSSEPESIIDSQASANATALLESNKTTAETAATETAGLEVSGEGVNEAMETVIRAVYMMTHDESEPDEDLVTWAQALHVTDAMVPGFISDYFQTKREERDEAEKELEQEERDKGESDKDEST